MKMFVTYGFGSNLGGCYSVVEKDTMAEAIREVHAVCGSGYAFTYEEKEFDEAIKRWNLVEVPLQSQGKKGEPYAMMCPSCRSTDIQPARQEPRNGGPETFYLACLQCDHTWGFE
jgi:DNA-directed RNA polymerase subunit M/transcription elongation factor TFIIS